MRGAHSPVGRLANMLARDHIAARANLDLTRWTSAEPRAPRPGVLSALVHALLSDPYDPGESSHHPPRDGAQAQKRRFPITPRIKPLVAGVVTALLVGNAMAQSTV